VTLLFSAQEKAGTRNLYAIFRVSV
jgi:hypothetical protein